MADVRCSLNQLATADLTGDGNYSLMAVDSRNKLRIFEDTRLSGTHRLFEQSSCVVTLDLPGTRLKTGVAVGTGSNVYVYSADMRPYLKFSLPSQPVNSVEKDLWFRFKQTQDSSALIKGLSEIPSSELTFRSSLILSVSDESEQRKYCDTYCNSELLSLSTVTALSSLMKNASDGRTVMIVGTEHGSVLMIEMLGKQQTKTTVHSLGGTDGIDSAIVQIHCDGQFNVDYRVLCLTRRRVITIRNGRVLRKSAVECESTPICMCFLRKTQAGGHFIVSCMNDQIYGFTLKGVESFTMRIGSKNERERGTCMAECKMDGIDSVALIGTDKGRVILIDSEGTQLHSVDIAQRSAVSCLLFDHYGRSQHSLIVVCEDGSLTVKIWRRTFELASLTRHKREQTQAFCFPSVSELAVQRMVKEQRDSSAMHYSYQRQRLLMKLQCARQYRSAICDHQSTNVHSSFLLSGQLFGIGPKFTAQITVENRSEDGHRGGLMLLVSFDPEWYQIGKSHIPISDLVDDSVYSTSVECLKPGNTKAVHFTLLCPALNTLARLSLEMPVWDQD